VDDVSNDPDPFHSMCTDPEQGFAACKFHFLTEIESSARAYKGEKWREILDDVQFTRRINYMYVFLSTN